MGKIKITLNELKSMIEFIIDSNNILCEGVKYAIDKDTGEKTVKYVPNKNSHFSTNIFDENKQFKYIIKYLPKSNVKSINLYQLDDTISKIWKKGVDKTGDKIKMDPSMDMFDLKNQLYVANIIKKNLPDFDYLLVPQSSSSFNKNFISKVLLKLGIQSGEKKGFMFIPDLLIKNIKNIQIDYEWLTSASNIGKFNEDELESLKKRINKWINNDEIIREKRREIIKLKSEIEELQSLKKTTRGRPSKEITTKKNVISNRELEIKDLRGKGRDSTVFYKKDDSGNQKPIQDEVKDWQIKSLEDKVRKAIKGFMVVNPLYSKLTHKFNNKKVILFDDNLSSGATMDDCAISLRSIGVNPKDILVITLGLIDPTVYTRSERRKE